MYFQAVSMCFALQTPSDICFVPRAQQKTVHMCYLTKGCSETRLLHQQQTLSQICTLMLVWVTVLLHLCILSALPCCRSRGEKMLSVSMATPEMNSGQKCSAATNQQTHVFLCQWHIYKIFLPFLYPPQFSWVIQRLNALYFPPGPNLSCSLQSCWRWMVNKAEWSWQLKHQSPRLCLWTISCFD